MVPYVILIRARIVSPNSAILNVLQPYGQTLGICGEENLYFIRLSSVNLESALEQSLSWSHTCLRPTISRLYSAPSILKSLD